MKKPKISLDKEKLQQFFLMHIEKILLGIVVCLMLLLIWRGFSLPHLTNDMTPQALVGKSDSAKQYIDTPDRWINEVKAKRDVPLDVAKRVGDVQKPSDPLAYMLVNSWMRPDFPKLSPREDPELFAPINLVVRPVVGALASFPVLRPGEEYHDPLYGTKSEEDLAKEKLRRRIEEKKKKKAELAGEMPGGEGGMPGPGARPKRGKKAPGGEDAGGGYTGGRGTPMPGSSAMPGGEYGGYGGAGMPGDRYPESLMFGFNVQAIDQTIARNLASITIMAVVPLQRQSEEFDKKLSNSLDYDPKRDYPTYLDFRVERADVTDLDPSAPLDDKRWQPLTRPDVVLKEIWGDPERNITGLYAGIPTEVIDPSYYSEQLTHPAPPYLQRDLWDLLTHPDVPLASVTLGAEIPGAGVAANAPGGDDDRPIAPLMGPGGVPGGGMPGGEGGYGGGMRGGGMMGRMPGGGSADGGYGGGMRGGGMPGGGYTPRPGGFNPMRGSDESAGMGYGSGMPTYTPPKHQLIRFTDTHVELGKKYRYRFRVRLNDPNHPAYGYQPPSGASLHADVRKRIKAIDDADAARPKDQLTGQPYRTYWIWSPWSDASPVAEVPRPERIFAGKVLPTRTQKIKNVDVATAEPTVDAFAIVFDHSKIADIPTENDKVGRGSVLNFVQKAAKVIHPVTKEVIEIPEYNVTTNALVADLMGGETIRAINAGTTSTTLTALGELLVVDADGKLHVQNEGQDIENVRRFTVPKVDPKAAKAAADAAAGLSGEGAAPVRGRPRAACF